MRKIFFGLLVFILGFLVFLPAQVSAKVMGGKNANISVSKSETVNDDLFVGANSVRIDGTVNGDVFVGAQSLIITGVINGSLHAGARTVSLMGKVTGNAYIGSQDIILTKAVIGGSLFAGTANLNIDKDTIIGGSLFAGTANAYIDSRIKRNAYLGVKNLTLGDDVRIDKNLYYASGKTTSSVNISPLALVRGTVYKKEFTAGNNNLMTVGKTAPAILGGFTFGAAIISYLGALIIGLLYFKYFRRHSQQVITFLTKKPWKSLGTGALVSILFIPAVIIMAVTVVGLPLAGISLVFLLLYMYLAKIVVAVPLATRLAKKFNWKLSPRGVFAAGLAVIYLLKLLPVVGGLVSLAIIWLGVGSLSTVLFKKTD